MTLLSLNVGLKSLKGTWTLTYVSFPLYINVWIVMFSQCLHAYNNNVWTFQLCFLWCCICIYVYLNQNSTSNNFWSRIQSSGIICKYFWKHKSILGIAILLSIYHKHFMLGSHGKIQCSKDSLKESLKYFILDTLLKRTQFIWFTCSEIQKFLDIKLQNNFPVCQTKLKY